MRFAIDGIASSAPTPATPISAIRRRSRKMAKITTATARPPQAPLEKVKMQLRHIMPVAQTASTLTHILLL